MEKIEDGWYLLCPECKALSKGGDWHERHTSVVEVKAFLLEMEDRAEPDFQDECIEDTTRDVTEHDCGFTTKEWNTEDFAVCVKDGKIVNIQTYWEYYTEDLKEIAEEIGLEVEIDEGEEG